MSELGSVERDYRTIRPDVRFGEALAVRGEDVADAEPAVHAWLIRIGLI